MQFWTFKTIRAVFMGTSISKINKQWSSLLQIHLAWQVWALNSLLSSQAETRVLTPDCSESSFWISQISLLGVYGQFQEIHHTNLNAFHKPKPNGEVLSFNLVQHSIICWYAGFTKISECFCSSCFLFVFISIQKSTGRGHCCSRCT